MKHPDKRTQTILEKNPNHFSEMAKKSHAKRRKLPFDDPEFAKKARKLVDGITKKEVK